MDPAWQRTLAGRRDSRAERRAGRTRAAAAPGSRRSAAPPSPSPMQACSTRVHTPATRWHSCRSRVCRMQARHTIATKKSSAPMASSPHLVPARRVLRWPACGSGSCIRSALTRLPNCAACSPANLFDPTDSSRCSAWTALARRADSPSRWLHRAPWRLTRTDVADRHGDAMRRFFCINGCRDSPTQIAAQLHLTDSLHRHTPPSRTCQANATQKDGHVVSDVAIQVARHAFPCAA